MLEIYQKIMTLNGIDITGHEISECFAGFFDKKVNDVCYGRFSFELEDLVVLH